MKNILFVALVSVGSITYTSKCYWGWDKPAKSAIKVRDFLEEQYKSASEAACYSFENTFKTIAVQGGYVEVDLIIDPSVTKTTVQVSKEISVGNPEDAIVRVSAQGDTLKLQERRKRFTWTKTRFSSHIKCIIRIPHTIVERRVVRPSINIQAGTVTFECKECIKNLTVKAGTATITAQYVSGNVKIDAGTFKGEIGIARSPGYRIKGFPYTLSVILKTGTAALTLNIPIDTYVPLDKITVSPAVIVDSQVPTVAVPTQDEHHFLDGRLYPLNLTVETGSGQITIVPAKA